MPQSYETLGGNPNITWKIIRDNPDKEWCFRNFSWNRHSHNINKNRIINRTKSIKEELMARTWNPETSLGKYLVLNELDE